MADSQFRTELKRPDEFVHFFGGIAQWASDHWKKVSYVILAATAGLLILLGSKVYQQYLSSEAAEAFYPIEKSIMSQDEGTAVDWNKVVSDLDGFIKRHGSSSYMGTACLYKGQALLRLGQFDKAREAYALAAVKLPKNFQYLGLEGQALALMEAKKYAEAEIAYRGLSEQKDNPLRANHTWHLGLAQEATGHKDQALTTYEKFEKEFQGSTLLERVQGRISVLKQK